MPGPERLVGIILVFIDIGDIATRPLPRQKHEWNADIVKGLNVSVFPLAYTKKSDKQQSL
jgi:hypothetical protein